MEKTNIAVIGLGGIAQVMHLPVLKKLNEVELVAVCDKDFSKAKNVAKKLGIKNSYKEVEDLFSGSPDISSVIISTQTDTHKDIAIKCLEAGLNVLVEKPIARNLKETKAIVDAADEHKKILMVGMNNRFRNDAMLQRSFVRNDEIGDLFYVKTGWLKLQSSNQKWFLEMEKSGGGVFLDNGIVMLDLGMWMLNFPDVKSVSAINYYHNSKFAEDSNFTLVKFVNGSALTIEVSWSLLRGGEFYYCNVFGTKGSTSINPLRIHKQMNGELFDITPKSVKTSTSIVRNSYEHELRHFIGTVRGTHQLISSGKEALKVMQVVDAIYKSAKIGKEVILK